MKKAICMLMVLFLLIGLMPNQIIFAAENDYQEECFENCHSLSAVWFGGIEEKMNQKSLAGVDNSINNMMDSYFSVRESNYKTHSAVSFRGIEQNISSAVKTDTEKCIEGISSFETKANFRITDAEVTTFYDNDHILLNKDGTLTVFAYEWTFFDYDDLRDEAVNTDVSGFGIYHKLVLLQSEKECTIISDEYDASDIFGICTMNESTRKELEDMRWEPIDTDDAVIRDLEHLVQQSQKIGDLQGYYSSYNPSACAEYADQYVYHGASGNNVYENYYNSAYYNFNSLGGDCANYTSQSIYAGGMPQVIGSQYGTDGWFYITSSNRSATWTGAPYLRDWMAANRGSKVTASNSTVFTGSPVFYNDAHATICVGKNSAGTPIINSHNYDRYHVLWNYWGSGTTYTTVQLTPSDPSVAPHTCNKGEYVYFEALHPHRNCYRCSICGNIWAEDGSSNYMDSCLECHRPEKPLITGLNSSYSVNDSISISWSSGANTTHCNYWLYYQDGNEWRVCNKINYASNPVEETAAAGNYRVQIVAYNSNYWEEDNSDWLHVYSDYAYFSVVGNVPDAPEISISSPWVKTGDTLTVSWSPVPDATSYEYYMAEYPFGFAYENYLLSGSTTETSVSFQAANLPNGGYCFFIHAKNAAGSSPQSNWVGVDVYNSDYTPTIAGMYDGHIYAVYDQDLSWTFAEQMCENAGGHLATITSTEENEYICSLINSGGKDAYWIGASNDTTGSWYDSDNPFVWVTGEEFSFTNWHPGEPNGTGSNANKEHFAEIRKSYDYQWNDKCNARTADNGFILEIDAPSWEPTASMTYGTSKYLLFDAGTTWSEAMAYCEYNGGHLATVSTSAEDAAISNLLQKGDLPWFYIGGCSVDGTWKWLDDTDVPLSGSYSNWSDYLGGTQAGPTGWGSYLMKYKSTGTWIGMPNYDNPVEHIQNLGFVMEIDNAVNTVTFDPNGGSVDIASKTIVYGEEYGELPIPFFGNYIFDGWYTALSEGEKITPTSTVSVKSDQTLYAHWIDRCAAGHTYEQTVIPPTCTEQGYTVYTCSVCGESYTDSHVPALGHNFSAWTHVSGSNPSAHSRSCSRCGETETAACVFENRHCTVCGYSLPELDAKLILSEERGTAGTSVTVELSVEKNPGIVSAYLDLNYDTTKLTLTNVEDTGLFKGALFGNNYAAVPFALNWDDSLAAENNTANGVIAKLTFQINEDCPTGSIPVLLSYTEGNIIDKDLNNVEFMTVNGSIEVVDYIPGDVDGDGQVLAKDVATLRRYLAHWADVMIVEPAADVNRDGNVTAQDVAILRRYLAHWTDVTISASPTPKAAAGSASPCGENDPTIEISSAEGSVGEQVTLNVELLNNPGIVSAYLDLSYDNTKLRLVSAEDTQLLNGALFSNDYTILPFALNWDDSIASANNTGSGTIARLTFEILEGCEGGPAAVSVSYVDGNILNYNLNNVDFAVESGTVSIHVHQYGEAVTAPTCTEQGFTTYTCKCGESYTDDYVNALGHDFGEWSVTKAPTCTEKGEETRTCSRCEAKETREVDALGHSFGQWTQTKAPTCTEKGEETRSCSRCEVKETREVDATGHIPGEPVEENFFAPSCENFGGADEVVRCTFCGEILSSTHVEYFPAGHDFGQWTQTKAPTCTAKGEETRACSRCEVKETREVDALGHDFGEWTQTKAPTCTTKGEETRACSRCDETETRELAMIAHSYVNGVCTVCGAKDPDYVPTVSFVDVAPKAYYYNAVAWAVANGVTTGTSATTFSPNDTCTRGQVVTFLWRAFGQPEPKSDKHPFTDVKSSAYYYKAVLWAVEKGVTAGTSATTFSPNGECTRGQVVTFLWRAAEKPAPTSTNNPFTDVKQGAYYYDAVLWAVEKGVTKGTGDTTFSPTQTCTRGQVVTFLHRAVGE